MTTANDDMADKHPYCSSCHHRHRHAGHCGRRDVLGLLPQCLCTEKREKEKARTQLDVIVEEEFARAGFSMGAFLGTFTLAVERIAERAFRHGAEQMAVMFAPLFGKNPDVSNLVQPAPAEEKGNEFVFTRAGKPCLFPECRKGERRNGQEYPWASQMYGQHFSMADHPFSNLQFDRRSGADRRRKP